MRKVFRYNYQLPAYIFLTKSGTDIPLLKSRLIDYLNNNSLPVRQRNPKKTQ